MSAQRNLLIFTSILECLLFSGIVLGWTSYVFVLKFEGIYRTLCNFSSNFNATTQIICEDQDKRLNLFFNIAVSVGYCLSAGTGVLHVKLSTRNLRLTFTIVFAVGMVLMAFTNKDVPWLFLPGLIASCVGGLAFIGSNMQIAALMKSGSKIYIALINGAFDSSGVTMLILKELVESGISMKYVFICLTILMVIISIIVTMLHTKEKSLVIRDHEMELQTTNEKDTQTNPDVDRSKTDPDVDRPKTEPTTKLECVQLKSWIISWSFLLQNIWFCMCALQFIYYMGSVNTQLEKVLKHSERVSDFTNVLGYILLLGLITSFLAGGFQEWQKYLFRGSSTANKRKYLPLVAPIAMVNLLAIALSVLGIHQSESTFIAEFCVIPLLRSTLFSVNMNWIITVFPPNYTGLVFGIMYTIKGFFLCLQYPLFSWAQTYEQAFTHTHYMFLVLASLTLLNSINILHHGHLPDCENNDQELKGIENPNSCTKNTQEGSNDCDFKGNVSQDTNSNS